MRLSVSNLGWGSSDPEQVRAILESHGISGVELAPTAVWPQAPSVDDGLLRGEREFWSRGGLAVSGVQSLLFGHPELRLFDVAAHDALHAHLTQMIRLASALGASRAVFGSPRNRLRGSLGTEAADELATTFFQRLTPVLEAEEVVLTLEPNAKAYGADYLTDYESCLRLARLVASEHVKAQIDTGCLAMENVDPALAVRAHAPGHVHVSAPNLLPPPGAVDHAQVNAALRERGYSGWCTLEMLPGAQGRELQVLESTVEWFIATYGEDA